MVNLSNVTTDYMEKVVFEEKLVTSSPECHKFAFNAYQKQVKENMKTQRTKFISLGGRFAPPKITIVHSEVKESLQNYPDLPNETCAHSSLTLNDYIYCIGGNNSNNSVLKGTDHVWRLNTKQQTSGWGTSCSNE